MSKEFELQVNQLAHGTRQVTNLDQIGEAHIELIDIKKSRAYKPNQGVIHYFKRGGG